MRRDYSVPYGNHALRQPAYFRMQPLRALQHDKPRRAPQQVGIRQAVHMRVIRVQSGPHVGRHFEAIRK